nr:MAG TPA: hypothetical protein [Caudoviricetes sp.]
MQVVIFPEIRLCRPNGLWVGSYKARTRKT